MRLHPASGFGFAAGASALLFLPELPNPLWPLLAAALLAGILALSSRSSAAGSTCHRTLIPAALAAALGFAYAIFVAQIVLADRLPPSLEGQEMEVSGHVASLPIREARSIRFDLRVDAVDERLPRRISLSWYDADATGEPGECIRARVKLKRPRGLVNPAGFDFERHALAARIGATGYVTTRLPSPDCSNAFTINQPRAVIATRIDELLPAGRVRATVKALAIGDQRELDERAWDLFRATGTSHLIAISGLHVSLAGGLGAGLVWLLYWLLPGLGLRWPRPQAMAVAALLCATLYAGLAGFSLPTVRTLITLAAMLAGVLLRRELGWWTRYALALWVVLLFDPLAPLTPGFWLSFGAVAWLILAFGERWAPLARWRLWVIPQLGLSLALLPLGLAFFQQTSLASPLVNLLAVPFVTFAVVPLLLLALASWPMAALSGALFKLAAMLVGVFDALIVIAAEWPASRWALPAPDPFAWTLALLGCLWLLAPRGWPARALGLFGLLPLLWPVRAGLGPGAYELIALDVGQGQAVLVRTASHAVLIDTGPGFQDGGDLGDRVLVPSLVQSGVDVLPRLIVSHTDSDHHGGTASVRARLAVDRVSTSAPGQIAGAHRCLPGERWQWDGVEFEILHPPALMPYLGNESSCVVRVQGQGGSALIPGDIGEVIEGRLVREQPAALDVDILLAPHHGSAGSSSAAFLDAVSPAWTIYSAGYRNRFDFPRAVVVERVRARGARQLTTGDVGAVHLLVRPDKAIEVTSERAMTWRWWRE